MHDRPTDLTDPDLYVQGLPHAVLARLRREGQVVWSHQADGDGFWSVTDYDLIQEVSRNPMRFSSARANGGFRLHDERANHGSLGASLMSMDPPEHPQHRELMAAGVGAAVLGRLEPGIRKRAAVLAAEVAERLHAGDDVDVVRGFAVPLTIGTLVELLGADAGFAPHIQRWSDIFIGEADPDLRGNWREAAIEMGLYGMDLWSRRREAPEDDLVSLLAGPRGESIGLTIEAFLSTFMILLVAGNETTRNSISGGVVRLLESPGLQTRLGREPAILRGFVQEAVRWVSPIIHMRRTVTEACELGGTSLDAGHKVVLWYAAANYDERIFADAHTFDPERFLTPGSRPHLGCGAAAHACLGRRLAEAQLGIAFAALLPHLGDVALAEPPRRLRSNFISGYKSVILNRNRSV